MQVIEPTPSQAAVVLQNYLKQRGLALKLSAAQEAIARTKGYSSWNALASAIPVRGEKSARSRKNISSEATRAQPAGGVDLQYFMDESERVRNADPEVQYALADLLKAKFAQALADTHVLFDYGRHASRDECCLEEGGPYLQVSYEHRLNNRFLTELVFTLREGALACYVRTWELEDGRPYEIYEEATGEFDTDAQVPLPIAPLFNLVGNALHEARRHREKLRQKVNV